MKYAPIKLSPEGAETCRLAVQRLKDSMGQLALQSDGTLAPEASKQEAITASAQDPLFTHEPTIRGQLAMKGEQ